MILDYRFFIHQSQAVFLQRHAFYATTCFFSSVFSVLGSFSVLNICVLYIWLTILIINIILHILITHLFQEECSNHFLFIICHIMQMATSLYKISGTVRNNLLCPPDNTFTRKETIFLSRHN